MSKKLLYAFFIIIALIIAFVLGMKMPTAKSVQSHAKVYEVKAAVRKLWEDHIVWTRNYIMSELANLGDLNDVTQRLLKNQVDIGNAIKPFYGDAAADKLTALLKEHIVFAADVVKAAKENRKEDLDANSKKWYKNADEIAAFLASANPHWSQDSLKDMLYKHLEYTTGETVARLQQKWQEDINFYDTNHDHMLMFSDMLVDGIGKQFPDKF